MMNEILFFIAIIASFSMLLLFFRFFGKIGIYSWIAIAMVIGNIEVTKCVDMFGLSTALGNVCYGTTFLATDILSELYGKHSAKKAVLIGFFSLVASTLLFQLSLLFMPNSQDIVSQSLHQVLKFLPRICVVSLLCYFISNRIDIFLFEWFGKHTKKLWIKNNAATYISQFFDTVAFSFAAFWGLFDYQAIIEIIISAYIIKIIVALCDTPFLYIAVKMFNRKSIPDA